MRSVIEAYGKVDANLAKHEPGFLTTEALTKLVVSGQDSYGMAAVAAVTDNGEPALTPYRRVILTIQTANR